MIDKLAVLEPFILETVMAGELFVVFAVIALVMNKRKLFYITAAVALGLIAGAWIVNAWGV